MSTVTGSETMAAHGLAHEGETLKLRSQGHHPAAAPKQNGSAAHGHRPKPPKGWNLDNQGKFRDYPGDVSELLIPSFAGQATMTSQIQGAAKLKYLGLVILGLSLFYLSSNSKVRTAGISILFPGAGFLAVGGVGGYFGFVITILLLPLCLFAWFGAGGLAFPLADWILSGIFATWLAKPQIVESSAIATLGLIGILYTFLWTRSSVEDVADEAKRDRRNTYMQAVDQKWQEESIPAAEPGTRELSLDQLRFLQHVIELALQDEDNWDGFTIVDQFQPAALRYQLYEFVNCLGVYQTHYTPNFRGYASHAMRNSIEKSLVPKVMNYWKWESLWGKFTTNYDPVIKDNIMVTGFLVLAIGIYQSVTGDDRYTKDESLVFQITNKIKYKHSAHSMYKALVQNWDESDFTLYPCEPNWIYSMCNLGGMAGATIYDRLFATREGTRIMKRFYRRFEEDFFTKGGSCIPIKSALTGFTIPGLCGIVGDTSNALFCTPFMPTLAKRMWLMTREENVEWKEDGEIQISGLKGADYIDGGNYKRAEYGPYAMFAPAAAEWGDERVAHDCLEKIDRLAPVQVNPKTGSKANAGVSVVSQGMLLRARIMQGGDWARTVAHGPEESCSLGPLLEDAQYPEVLVAKAYSHTSEDLELVLYPGIGAGSFNLTLSRLKPNGRYIGQDNQVIVADVSGRAKTRVKIDGRTHLTIVPKK